jgi:hypothetical protein
LAPVLVPRAESWLRWAAHRVLAAAACCLCLAGLVAAVGVLCLCLAAQARRLLVALSSSRAVLVLQVGVLRSQALMSVQVLRLRAHYLWLQVLLRSQSLVALPFIQALQTRLPQVELLFGLVLVVLIQQALLIFLLDPVLLVRHLVVPLRCGPDLEMLEARSV